MLSKSWLKYVNSLQIKKYRHEHRTFLVEGAKSVQELLSSNFEIEIVFGTEEFLQENKLLLAQQSTEVVKTADLEKLGTFATNNAAIAVAKMQQNAFLSPNENELILVLDDIKDPGNLGTIIRIADWYGIKKIICSESTVDFYNPKVIAATMGSFLRIQCYYTNLADYFEKQNLPVLGAVLNGESVHEFKFPTSGFLVIGNESNGIGSSLLEKLTHHISIPQFGGAESLNAGIATAVILDNWRRVV